MIYGSVCSGMEAATAAWHKMGWRPAFFSEIDATASRFLREKYPHVPNRGDMTNFKDWPDAAIDILVGGTPCQSFSVAGLRKGLADPRGNLMLTYLAIVDRYRPQWVVWENVPGVLSSTSHVAPDPVPPPPPLDLGCDGAEVDTQDEYDGEEFHAFNTFLAGLSELGYGFAYRVLDAQYVRVESHPRAVPQRRRRVIVVGHLGDWQPAAAVLFERESLSGHPAPRRETRQGIACGIEIGPGGGGFTDVNPTLDCRAKDGPIRNQLAGAVMTTTDVSQSLLAKPNSSHDHSLESYVGVVTGGVPPTSLCLNAGAMGRIDAESETLIPTIGGGFDVADTMKAMKESGGWSNSVDHAAGGYMIPVHAFPERLSGTQVAASENLSPSLGATNPMAVAHPMVLMERGREGGRKLEYRADGTANAILIPNGGRGGFGVGAIATQWAVRRLTPLECTRLQGYPDDYFDGLKKPLSDGAQYKLLGNSKATNVVTWVGERIEKVTTILAAATHFAEEKELV